MRRWQLAIALGAAALSACTVLPKPGFPPRQEREVWVDYDSMEGPVEVPASRRGLTVTHLSTEPQQVRERFVGEQRFLVTDAPTLQLRCRYRVDQPTDAQGRPQPYPTPAQLFPGATRIRTTWLDGAPVPAPEQE
ncbi:MAG: hypothetical protein AAF628_28065 [Planctomycetota bacterium]